MKKGVSTKRFYGFLVPAVGLLAIVAGVFWLGDHKRIKKPDRNQAFSQKQTLSKKTQQEDEKKIQKLLEW